MPLEHVFDATADNFSQLVVDNSRKGPVLVNYWTASAGPCFKLWQELEALSREYNGRFLLVNVNIDKQKELARRNGITSVPTVKVYQHGAVVDSIYGAQSQTALRAVIDRYAQPVRDTAMGQAILAYQAGRVEEALKILETAADNQADNLKLHATAIKILMREQRYSDIEKYMTDLPESLQDQAALKGLRIHARMFDLAAQAPPLEVLEARCIEAPGDLDNLMQRAAVAMVQDDYAMALDLLLQVIRHDRDYAEQLPRKAMLVMFSLLGENHELTRAGQKQLRELLH
ncbi:MAG: tetratricopeptide repeat protein [Thiogranum sp.]|nr:tetratricopeptide repeat protein [Thiogranum sp.]